MKTRFVPAAAGCLALVCVFVAAGCTMMRGAPMPLVSDEVYQEPGRPLFVTDEHIASLAAARSEAGRNEIMALIVASIDVRYAGFRHSLVANRKHVNGAMDLAQLGANVASTLTDSIGVKTNFAQLGVLLTGSKGIVDSNYLFAQTTLAIVSQMDANRSRRYTQIIQGMRSPLQDYPGPRALQDCIEYFNAGTILSGIVELNKDAAGRAQEEASKARIAESDGSRVGGAGAVGGDDEKEGEDEDEDEDEDGDEGEGEGEGEGEE